MHNPAVPGTNAKIGGGVTYIQDYSTGFFDNQ
jgi:hypothetical protein